MSSNFWNELGFHCGCGRGALPGASGASVPGLGVLCTNRLIGRGDVYCLVGNHLLSFGQSNNDSIDIPHEYARNAVGDPLISCCDAVSIMWPYWLV
jgi:hypothetical protein